MLFLLALTLAGNTVFSSCSQDEGTINNNAAQKMKFCFSSDDSETGAAKAATRGTAETKTTLSNSIGMSCYTGAWNDDTSLPDFVEITHRSVNDGTVECMRHKELTIFSVQYHPEASPGPTDNLYLFDEFEDMMRKGK